MVEATLHGCRILVVEDEYFLAEDLREVLSEAGAEVLGPVATVADAARLIASAQSIDAAVLDINLRGEAVFPIADSLLARGVPFIFATGYDQWTMPERFADAPRLEKPQIGSNVLATIRPLLLNTKAR